MRCSALMALLLILSIFITSQVFAKANEKVNSAALRELLSGKSTDVSGVAASLLDDKLPVALGVGERLTFLAVQREIKLSVEEARRFKAEVMKRISLSVKVSLKKSETCPVAVPASTCRIGAHSISVPAYFRAPAVLSIDSVAPTGEAGLILPEVSFCVSGAEQPANGKLTLDGKSQTIEATTDGFRRSGKLDPESALTIGTHTAQAFVRDATGAVASRAWIFTVGVEPVFSPPIPGDAVAIGSFTISLQKIFGKDAASGTMLVRVFQLPDGKRVCEYVFLDAKTGKPLMKTTGLASAKRLKIS